MAQNNISIGVNVNASGISNLDDAIKHIKLVVGDSAVDAAKKSLVSLKSEIESLADGVDIRVGTQELRDALVLLRSVKSASDKAYSEQIVDASKLNNVIGNIHRAKAHVASFTSEANTQLDALRDRLGRLNYDPATANAAQTQEYQSIARQIRSLAQTRENVLTDTKNIYEDVHRRISGLVISYGKNDGLTSRPGYISSERGWRGTWDSIRLNTIMTSAAADDGIYGEHEARRAEVISKRLQAFSDDAVKFINNYKADLADIDAKIASATDPAESAKLHTDRNKLRNFRQYIDKLSSRKVNADEVLTEFNSQQGNIELSKKVHAELRSSRHGDTLSNLPNKFELGMASSSARTLTEIMHHAELVRSGKIDGDSSSPYSIAQAKKGIEALATLESVVYDLKVGIKKVTEEIDNAEKTFANIDNLRGEDRVNAHVQRKKIDRDANQLANFQATLAYMEEVITEWNTGKPNRQTLSGEGADKIAVGTQNIKNAGALTNRLGILIDSAGVDNGLYSTDEYTKAEKIASELKDFNSKAVQDISKYKTEVAAARSSASVASDDNSRLSAQSKLHGLEANKSFYDELQALVDKISKATERFDGEEENIKMSKAVHEGISESKHGDTLSNFPNKYKFGMANANARRLEELMQSAEFVRGNNTANNRKDALYSVKQVKEGTEAFAKLNIVVMELSKCIQEAKDRIKETEKSIKDPLFATLSAEDKASLRIQNQKDKRDSSLLARREEELEALRKVAEAWNNTANDRQNPGGTGGSGGHGNSRRAVWNNMLQQDITTSAGWGGIADGASMMLAMSGGVPGVIAGAMLTAVSKLTGAIADFAKSSYQTYKSTVDHDVKLAGRGVKFSDMYKDGEQLGIGAPQYIGMVEQMTNTGVKSKDIREQTLMAAAMHKAHGLDFNDVSRVYSAMYQATTNPLKAVGIFNSIPNQLDPTRVGEYLSLIVKHTHATSQAMHGIRLDDDRIGRIVNTAKIAMEAKGDESHPLHKYSNYIASDSYFNTMQNGFKSVNGALGNTLLYSALGLLDGDKPLTWEAIGKAQVKIAEGPSKHPDLADKFMKAAKHASPNSTEGQAAFLLSTGFGNFSDVLASQEFVKVYNDDKNKTLNPPYDASIKTVDTAKLTGGKTDRYNKLDTQSVVEQKLDARETDIKYNAGQRIAKATYQIRDTYINVLDSVSQSKIVKSIEEAFADMSKELIGIASGVANDVIGVANDVISIWNATTTTMPHKDSYTKTTPDIASVESYNIKNKEVRLKLKDDTLVRRAGDVCSALNNQLCLQVGDNHEEYKKAKDNNSGIVGYVLKDDKRILAYDNINSAKADAIKTFKDHQVWNSASTFNDFAGLISNGNKKKQDYYAEKLLDYFNKTGKGAVYNKKSHISMSDDVAEKMFEALIEVKNEGRPRRLGYVVDPALDYSKGNSSNAKVEQKVKKEKAAKSKKDSGATKADTPDGSIAKPYHIIPMLPILPPANPPKDTPR